MLLLLYSDYCSLRQSGSLRDYFEHIQQLEIYIYIFFNWNKFLLFCWKQALLYVYLAKAEAVVIFEKYTLFFTKTKAKHIGIHTIAASYYQPFDYLCVCLPQRFTLSACLYSLAIVYSILFTFCSAFNLHCLALLNWYVVAYMHKFIKINRFFAYFFITLKVFRSVFFLILSCNCFSGSYANEEAVSYSFFPIRPSII